jgi:adenylate cyclase
MVCYYWPYKNENKDQAFQNALMGAVELSKLQKRFFCEVVARYKSKINPAILQIISLIVDAGIGLSSGTVVMGDLGPKQGVRKFGILGDPMNLTARIESLTRHFNCEIIVTADFYDTAKTLGIPVRRLGRFCVKGRTQPEVIYAVSFPDDPRFLKEDIDLWEAWLSIEEQGIAHNFDCPSIYKKDRESFGKWKTRSLLKNGIWHLDEK